MTPTELATHAEALAGKATKGPWALEGVDGTPVILAAGGVGLAELYDPDNRADDYEDSIEGSIEERDGELMAASRDLVPQLAAALKEACEILDLVACGGDYPYRAARAFLARDVEEATCPLLTFACSQRATRSACSATSTASSSRMARAARCTPLHLDRPDRRWRRL